MFLNAKLRKKQASMPARNKKKCRVKITLHFLTFSPKESVGFNSLLDHLLVGGDVNLHTTVLSATLLGIVAGNRHCE